MTGSAWRRRSATQVRVLPQRGCDVSASAGADLRVARSDDRSTGADVTDGPQLQFVVDGQSLLHHRSNLFGDPAGGVNVWDAGPQLDVGFCPAGGDRGVAQFQFVDGRGVADGAPDGPQSPSSWASRETLNADCSGVDEVRGR